MRQLLIHSTATNKNRNSTALVLRGWWRRKAAKTRGGVTSTEEGSWKKGSRARPHSMLTTTGVGLRRCVLRGNQIERTGANCRTVRGERTICVRRALSSFLGDNAQSFDQ